MNPRFAIILPSFVFAMFLPGWVAAQAPTPPPPEPTPLAVYTGSFGGGIAVTGGNTDTKNFNLSFGLIRDPKKKNLVKFNALYLRGSQNDILAVDRATATLRDEYTVSNRTFVFAQTDYLRDEFKEIRYLIAPVGGMGYKVINDDRTSLSFSGGSGGIWEKDAGLATKGTGNVNAGESFTEKLSTATITQSIGTLWKTDDFSDSLSNFALALSTSISRKLELKLEFQDSYKNRPALVTIKKNDTAYITTLLVKF